MGSRSSETWRTLVRLVTAGAVAAAVSVMAAAQLATAQPPRRDPAQRAAERIRALQKEAESLATQEGALLAQLRKLEVERQLRVEELAQIDRNRGEAERSLANTSARADALQRTAQDEEPEIEGRLVRVYKLGHEGFWRLLLDVDDLRSAARAYRTAAALTQIDRERVLDHQRTLEALATEQRELRQRLARIAELQTQARTARAAADRAVAERTALIASIDARRDLNAQLTSELQAAQQRLQASVDQLGSGAAATMLPLKPFQGALPWPARGRVVSRFGRESTSRFGTTVARNGVELAVLEGQPVRAVHDGTVAYADRFTGYGELVIIEHGDKTYSLYGYLGAISVAKGDRVEAQAPIGTSGTDPSGNPALYFELRVDGKPVDPLQWLIRE
jgi:septal ring factor EnvC (AmiA/AmiB activator)